MNLNVSNFVSIYSKFSLMSSGKFMFKEITDFIKLMISFDLVQSNETLFC